MNWYEILMYVIKALVGLAVTVGIPLLISWLKTKTDNDALEKVLDMVGQTVTDCVLMIDQTFVDPLKKAGKWDDKTAAEAFENCKTQILILLSDEMKSLVVTLYGDLETWLKAKIEAEVRNNKK
jgi:hypothetical protein